MENVRKIPTFLRANPRKMKTPKKLIIQDHDRSTDVPLLRELCLKIYISMNDEYCICRNCKNTIFYSSIFSFNQHCCNNSGIRNQGIIARLCNEDNAIDELKRIGIIDISINQILMENIQKIPTSLRVNSRKMKTPKKCIL